MFSLIPFTKWLGSRSWCSVGDQSDIDSHQSLCLSAESSTDPNLWPLICHCFARFSHRFGSFCCSDLPLGSCDWVSWDVIHQTFETLFSTRDNSAMEEIIFEKLAIFPLLLFRWANNGNLGLEIECWDRAMMDFFFKILI